jgi:hypothetical protein
VSFAAKGMNALVVGTPQLGRDVLKPRSLLGSLTDASRFGRYPHQRKEPFNFSHVDPDTSLSASAPLEVVDRDRLTAELELPSIGLG